MDDSFGKVQPDGEISGQRDIRPPRAGFREDASRIPRGRREPEGGIRKGFNRFDRFIHFDRRPSPTRPPSLATTAIPNLIVVASSSAIDYLRHPTQTLEGSSVASSLGIIASARIHRSSLCQFIRILHCFLFSLSISFKYISVDLYPL